ncbi:polysaccharide pyruvyl transferase family protein [Thermosipho ferrireducens]|uniref:Polysaccharide pyruvyl transferase family protein n=1 Tax=Thermosipho ferrireducens TaxID=2571116 RepID=A0ABX7S825_9BACT|nr:polysaccharide pyruvyl transferase family protein [Thermosipho ferrireducens]QTA38749.1 polysaccharide pyruvyl transferase family protein [Thermosipho ferrireducens]
MKNLLLIGYYGFGNLGDEMMVSTIKDFLLSQGFNVNIPVPKEKILNQKQFNRFNILKLFENILKADAIICGGGGVLQDKTSFKSFFYYYSIFEFSLLMRKPVIFFGNSFGPVRKKLSMLLLKRLLKQKKLYIFARDPVSSKYASQHNSHTFLATDPAIRFLSKLDITPSKRTDTAVIIPRKFRSYIPVLLNLKHLGFKNIIFLPFAPEDEILAKRLANFSIKGLNMSFSKPEEAIEKITKASVIISERFHGSLTAAYFDIPFISVKDEKFRRFITPYLPVYPGFAFDILDAAKKIELVLNESFSLKGSLLEACEGMYTKFGELLHNLV